MGVMFLTKPLIAGLGLISVSLFLLVLYQGYRVFWYYLIFILFGYQFLGKGFAYLGIPPLYVGEIGIILALLSVFVALFLTGDFNDIKFNYTWVVTVILLFMFWGALTTFPYLGEYSLNALRDGVVWGYAIFALTIFILVPKKAIDQFFDLYGKVLPYYLLWLVGSIAFSKIFSIDITVPGSSQKLLQLRSGDVGFQLAGVAAFILLKLNCRVKDWSKPLLWGLWMLWFITWLGYGISNRAATLAALSGLGVVTLFRPNSRWDRPVILALTLICIFFVFDFRLEYRTGETLSSELLTENFTSIVGENKAISETGLEATKQWRLRWWRKIIGYTLLGDYFWVGKGYGIDLGVEDNMVHDRDAPARSPHNVSMTVLARSGVPGFIIWLIFLLSFAWGLFGRSWTTQWQLGPRYENYALWILAWWFGLFLESCFGVIIEGPVGGIWFWSLVGISLVYFSGKENPTRHRYNQN